jgi:hypothetical protein
MSSEETASAIGCMGLFPAMILSYVLRGWAIVTLWGWFMTPVFHVQPPSGAIAIGLGIVGGMLAGTSDIEYSSADTKDKSVGAIMWNVYAKLLLRAPTAVGLGWIVKHWA